jgi:glutathione-regulated potassium-efflux system protein KefB
MTGLSLADFAILLAALAVAAPLARALKIGAVLGYLLVGVLIGPYGIRSEFTGEQAKQILHIAEFGIVLLLFIIGLELRPKRLWSMRRAVFGLGGAQVAITGSILALIAILFGLNWQTALFCGLALALSSTAFALQVMEETGELSARHGRLGFSVLLFQDLAAIPLIALVPLFAVTAMDSAPGMDLITASKALGAIVAVIVVGYFALDHVLKFVALSGVKEAMTATALLTVVTVAGVMSSVGLSPALGAFIAGALLAESSYRHQLEADLDPFKGLLLGVFFTAVGMTLNLGLIKAQPGLVAALVIGLVAVKALVLMVLGRGEGLAGSPARRLGLALSQGGEFAFVLFAQGLSGNVLSKELADLLSVVVTLSMALTPLLLGLERWITRMTPAPVMAFDALPENEGHVVIAGFGRFGQITARVLRAKKIPFTALDISAEQVELVKKFGSQAFFGDASRPDILDAAQTGKARAFVLAIDDIEASMRTAEFVKQHYPHVPIYARARNRNHAHRLLDLGVKNIQRETFLSALETAKQLLVGLGASDREAARAISTFKAHDERRLIEDYKFASDMEKLQSKARSDAATLEQLFAEDAEEDAKLQAQTATAKETVSASRR